MPTFRAGSGAVKTMLESWPTVKETMPMAVACPLEVSGTLNLAVPGAAVVRGVTVNTHGLA